MRRTLPTIFFAALAIRWSYSVAMYAAMGDAGLLGVDSGDYIVQGQVFAAAFSNATLQGWDWLGPKPIMMPLYTWALAANVLVAGQHAAFLYVLMQGLFDAGTCLLIYGMARTVDPRLALPAAIAAVINPTQIVIAGQVYPDTLFVFFVALFLFGALRWLRAPSWSAVLTIAVGMALSSWFRILVTPFVPVLAIVLLVGMAASGRYRRVHLTQLATAVTIFILSLAPISLRNAAVYDTWALTPQVGMHLARWVVPLTWEVNGQMSWASGYEEIERRADKLPHTVNENPFHQSRRYIAVSVEALSSAGMLALTKAWLYGAAINLGTPAILLSPPISSLPRTGFYGTTGQSALEKIGNFMFRSDNKLYAYALLLGVAGVAIVRVLQLCGLAALLRQGHAAAALLLVLWCSFILAVNGPVASPKYRLPMEPALALFTAAGWLLLRRKQATAAGIAAADMSETPRT